MLMGIRAVYPTTGFLWVFCFTDQVFGIRLEVFGHADSEFGIHFTEAYNRKSQVEVQTTTWERKAYSLFSAYIDDFIWIDNFMVVILFVVPNS